jgi:hypothetical protein
MFKLEKETVTVKISYIDETFKIFPTFETLNKSFDNIDAAEKYIKEVEKNLAKRGIYV